MTTKKYDNSDKNNRFLIVCAIQDGNIVCYLRIDVILNTKQFLQLSKLFLGLRFIVKPLLL